MKKVLALVLVIFTCGALMGCPKPNPQPNNNPPTKPTKPTNEPAINTPQEAADLMEQVATEKGFKVDVSAKDVNGNGVPDLVVNWNSATPDDDSKVNALLYVTGLAAGVATMAQFKTDLVVLNMGGQKYQARVSDCLKCYQLIEANAADDKVVACIAGAWGLE